MVAEVAELPARLPAVVQPWHDGRPVSFAAAVLQPARDRAEDVAAIVLNGSGMLASVRHPGMPACDHERGRDGPGSAHLVARVR